MEKELACFERRAKIAEDEIKLLIEEVNNLKNIKINDVVEENDPELNELATHNIKLKHRLAILKRAVEERKASSLKESGDAKKSKMSQSVRDIDGSGPLQILTSLFTSAVEAAFPEVPDPPIIVSLSPKYGGYQCNSALPLSKLLKSQGISTPPPVVAKKIVENVPKHPLVENIEVAGAGFINISLSKDYVANVLTKDVLEGIKPPPVEHKRIVVDFSSPNIAKEMHVGHLRSTIIGESICRILEFLGHDVVRINHVGDWGTQFGMLIAHLRECFPDFATNLPAISDLQAFYKEAKVRFDEDSEFKKRAYACVVQLQKFEPEHKRAWEMICDVSRKEFEKIYKRLGVTIKERGESFYQTRMEKIVKWLDSKGYLEEDEGRKIMWGSEKDKGPLPLTIIKSDGGFTYDTSDMACVEQRVKEEKADWIIYVTDSGQSTHFQVLESCAKRCGLLPPTVKFTHVGFGVVLGEDRKKFKTRSGDTVRLNDLLDEGLSRSLETLKAKGRDQVLTPEELHKAMESVAYGCIKYADLSHNRNAEYVFSFDRMLEDKGNTAVYLLYNLTRIRSISRTAGVSSDDLKAAAKRGILVSVDHEKEWKLAKVLIRFSDVIMECLKDMSLHKLCDFAYEIATSFSEFYDSCYCVEKDSSGDIQKVHHNRLLLCDVSALIMAHLFALLGIDPVSHM